MPESKGYNNILVVVDRFSKEAVFIPCTKEETALSTAELFWDHVWCQHGLPSTVVSDRGAVFASQFLGELYKILGIKRKMSTVFHPQTDGQTERMNWEINQYLHTYIHDWQSQWSKWIKVAQFIWNNTVSSVTTDSPFRITRSYLPRMGIEPVNVKAPAAKDFAALFKKVAEASQKAKESMKLQADKHQSPAPEYKVGQQVWLSTDHLRMLNQPSKKLMERWIGPYDVLRVAPNAVELKLPKSLWIHPVVNVSWVKPYLRSLPGQPVLHPGPIHVTEDRDEEYEVDYIVDSRLYKGGLQYLVHWKGYGEEERTWEPASHLANAPELVAAFRKRNPSAPRRLRMPITSFNSLFHRVPTSLCQWDQPPFCHLEYDS
jgi:Chromo (CHRromatin Organisation MOdifier) domain